MGKTILRKRVDISTWNFIFTILAVGLVILVCILQFNCTDQEGWVWLLLGFITIWGFLTLFFCPMYVKLTEEALDVETSIRVKRFSLDEIESVKICPPTMSEKRLVGGNTFGYWGWFREPSIGKYFAYYGMASQTFLIRLKSGRQYMLGCRDSKEMAEVLAHQLTKIHKQQ